MKQAIAQRSQLGYIRYRLIRGRTMLANSSAGETNTPNGMTTTINITPATPIVGLMKMTTQKDDTIRTAYVVEDDGRRPDAIETSGGRGG